ncbi:MAG: NAD-dependent epimerase/dehydratase family protein [bacterium]
MKILVTGGAGFIGSNIADKLIEMGHEVSILDNLSTGKKENLNPKAKFYHVDLLDPNLSKVFQDGKFEVVYHLAAQIDLRKSVADPAYDANINIVGSLKLLQECVKAHIKKFIFSSTGGALYGEVNSMPVSEEGIIQPLSSYGIAKRSVELYLYMFNKVHNLNFTVLRYGNVYGPRQDPMGEAGVNAIFIGKMLSNEGLTINGDGDQERDYVYVGDVVNANILALNKGDGGSYNVGNGMGITVNKIFADLAQIIGYKKAANYGPGKAGEIYKNYLRPFMVKILEAKILANSPVSLNSH